MTNMVHFCFGRSGSDDTEHRSGCKQPSLDDGHFRVAFIIRLFVVTPNPRDTSRLVAARREVRRCCAPTCPRPIFDRS
jgi:hypothetical protein